MAVQNTVNGILYGTTTNDNADPGVVGEYISSSVLIGSAVALTSGVIANVTSIALTPGDWTVSGLVIFNPGVLTTSTGMKSALSIVAATFPVLGIENNTANFGISIAAGQSAYTSIGPMRLSIAANTTTYLIAQSAFLLGTMSAYGFIGARRTR